MQDSVLPQGCGGGVAPTSSHLSLYSIIPSIAFILFIAFIPSKFLTQVCHFFENFGDFRLLKTFLSYQQVINNSPFSTQFFENPSAIRPIFDTFAQLC